MICPHCGGHIPLADLISLSPQQQKTLDAVRFIARRDRRRTASTRAIAGEIGYSERWVLEWLHYLEKVELVNRPRGKKSGWAAVAPATKQNVILQLPMLEQEKVA